VLVVAVLVLSACGEDRPQLVATDVSSLRITGEQEQGSAYFANLSPDGKTLLYNSKRGTCGRGVDGSNEHCLGNDVNGGLDVGSAAWSPDGGRLALTNEFALGLEPDLWVLDVHSGQLANLTDDHVTTTISVNTTEFPNGATVDVYPSWSADGQQLRFVRRQSADRSTLMSIPSGGGGPKPLRSIDTNWERLQQVAWTKDTIAWLSGSPQGGDGEVWVADLVGGEPRKLLDGEYRILSFSADGEFLLADQHGKDGAAAQGTARVVPTRGGEPIPVAGGAVTYPTWAPKGHAIAYIEAPGTLRVVGKPGGEPRELHHEDQLGAADLDNLDWVPGRLLVKRGDDIPLILTITE
jgi:Tol biopolymer transport system component